MSIIAQVLGAFLFGAVCSLIITPIVIRIAVKNKIVAKPWIENRPHVPLLGGVSIATAFIFGMLLFFTPIFESGDILIKYLFGLILGIILLVLGGIFDDKYSLQPKKQFIFPVLAVLVVIVSGIGVTFFTNPFFPEKLVYINTFQKDLITFKGIPYKITLPADIITFIWLGLIMYSTKLQDGLDGLVSGISFIGASFIFLLSFFVFNDIPLAILSALFAGVLLGFLRYNFFPGKIFLGESGSLLAGFILGVLALLSDAKVIITLLLLAIPIADAIWTVVRRLYKRKPFWKGDEDHLHHRLIKAGFSPKKVILLLYGVTFTFGVLVMLWQSSFQYYFFGIVVLAILIIITLFSYTYKSDHLHSKE